MGLTFVEVTVALLNDPSRMVRDQFLVDSGASLTVLPEDIWKALGLEAEDTVTPSAGIRRAPIRVLLAKAHRGK